MPKPSQTEPVISAVTSTVSPNVNKSATDVVSWLEIFLFVLCSVSCMFVVFGSTLWSASLLTPLDIPAALYSKYHWLDPAQGPIPSNHYLVDFFDYEMPHQYRSYQGIQSGEFPWWDPYTDYGRPLAAETQFGGTDVIRLILYRCLPFVPAYNLSRLLPSLLLGLGAFLLLRHWDYRRGQALAVALAYQFAGIFVLLQNPIWVPGAIAWYAWIWLAWSCYLRSRRVFWIILAGLFCALSTTAGSVQTDAFLAVFAACFFFGTIWNDRNTWRPALIAAVLSPLLGVLLALPVLIPQIELYELCMRRPEFARFSKIQVFTGIASLSGFFPWVMGTFRTIDISKLFNQMGLGFSFFIGSTALILSTVGIVNVFQPSRRTAWGCVSFLLVAFYLMECSTPLVAVFYTRFAAVAALGLIVLAADGARSLWKGMISRWQKRLALVAIAGVLGVALCCNIFAFWVYPHIQNRVASLVLKREKNDPALKPAPELRQFQVQNLPREISVLDLETVVSIAGVGALLAAFFSCDVRWRTRWLALALALNIIPELSFAERFTSRSPVGLWQKLLTGGPEQNLVREALHGGVRLREFVPGRFDYLFPGSVADLYGIHVVGGYSSLMLPDITAEWDKVLGRAPLYDATYVSEKPGQPTGQFTMLPRRATPARFQWGMPSNRGVHILSESLNTITVEVDDGKPGILWRTDRFYPGWRLISPQLETSIQDKYFLTVKVPVGRQVLVFQYRPRFLTPSLLISAASVLGCILGLIFPFRRRKLQDDSIRSGGCRFAGDDGGTDAPRQIHPGENKAVFQAHQGNEE